MARILVMGGFAESLVNFRGALLQEMIARGHEVYACSPEASGEIEATLTEYGVTYIPVTLDRTGLNPIHDLLSIKELFTVFRSIKPDFFLGYTIKPVIFGSIIAKVTGTKNIYSMIEGVGYVFSGETRKQKLLKFIATKLYRLALKINKKIFFLNPDDQQLFIENKIINNTYKSVIINGCGVDIDSFSPADYTRELSFLMIARLLKDKGVYEYAEAARIIKKRFSNIKFYLVGWIDSNPMSINPDDLEHWVKSGIIDYLGKLDDVRPAIEKISVYVLPSYREGVPRTVLEAMAMGRPVITTDAPGCRETVVDGFNGYMVPVRDVNGLVKAMEKFIKQPDLVKQMGHASRKIVEDKYDVHKVNAAILEVMEIT